MKITPRILLVGAGKYGLNHARILKRLEKEKKIKFVGIVVRNKSKYEDIGSELGVNLFSDLNPELLRDVDAVDIVTPPESHFEIAKDVLKFTNVFIEKPITTNLDHAIILKKLAERYNHLLFVGHVFRYHPVTKKLKSILASKRLPQKINGEFINPLETDKGREPSLEMLHFFDIVDYLWKKTPKNVFVRKEGRTSIVDIRYNRCDAHFVLGWRNEDRKRLIKFRYSNSSIEADFSTNVIKVFNDKNDKKIKIYKCVNKDEPLYIELLDFINILKSKSNKSNVDMAIRVTSISLRAIIHQIKKPKVAIIGGGIFGLSVAGEIGDFCDVTLFEKNKELMQEGTLINQFRHHYGYHYPRSDETVIDVQRSRADFENIFKDALFIDSPTYYALAKDGSRVGVKEFIKFCDKHHLPYKIEYPPDDFLAKKVVDLSIRVPEPSYHHSILKRIAEDRIRSMSNVKMNLNTTVENCIMLSDGKKQITYSKNGKIRNEQFDYIINATYANINRFSNWLKFENCPIRVDLAEVLIIKIPVNPISVTVIDGLFATLMPTGNPNEFTLYHVKESIIDRYVPTNGLVKKVKKYKTNKESIFKESLKFFPILKESIFIESRIVHRGVQAYHEHDDARVADLIEHGFGCWSILSGKILSSVTTAKRLAKIIKQSIE